jgi:hypothetical protein
MLFTGALAITNVTIQRSLHQIITVRRSDTSKSVCRLRIDLNLNVINLFFIIGSVSPAVHVVLMFVPQNPESTCIKIIPTIMRYAMTAAILSIFARRTTHSEGAFDS